MNQWYLTGAILVLSGMNGVFALDLVPTETFTPSVPKPVALPAGEKIKDSSAYPLPRPPRQYIDGTKLALANDEDRAPQGLALLDITDPKTLQQIPDVNKADRHSGKYYWHPFKGWNYCHYREGDRQWYGWHTGGTFHWVLWRFGRFWWRDNYAQRWLYLERGCWWWQDPKIPGQFQVFLDDGHYHSCDANGVLGDDFLRAGTEEVETAPVAKPSPEATPRAKHGGHHGGHHNGGETGGEMSGGLGGNEP